MPAVGRAAPVRRPAVAAMGSTGTSSTSGGAGGASVGGAMGVMGDAKRAAEGDEGGCSLCSSRRRPNSAAMVFAAILAGAHHIPPAGPQWRRGLVALEPHPRSYDQYL